MKSTLIASIPAFVVIFALAFGFGTFYLIIHKAEATGGAACNYLEYNCNQEQDHARTACNSGNVERCKNAKADLMQVCSEFYSTCD